MYHRESLLPGLEDRQKRTLTTPSPYTSPLRDSNTIMSLLSTALKENTILVIKYLKTELAHFLLTQPTLYYPVIDQPTLYYPYIINVIECISDASYMPHVQT